MLFRSSCGRLRMHNTLTVCAAFIAFSAAAACAGDTSKDQAQHLKDTAARLERMSGGKVGEYAKEYLEAAKLSLFMAQAAGAGGNEKLALQRAELAELQ